MTVQTFTVDQLVVSPFNVRTNTEDAEATDALEASIAAHGLLFPVVVHPLTAGQALRVIGDIGSARYGVLAGGRRLRAIRNLVESGSVPANFPIDAIIRDVDPAEITELSLAENLLRRDLRPYEVHAAIARASAEGGSAEDIAARCGQRVKWVRQQLRLGTLAPEVFTAYAEERIGIEEARAYAATEDHELQLAAFHHFEQQPRFSNNPALIRIWLKIGDGEEARLLAFVDAAVYRAAGGRFELDLFADGPDERGRVVDVALLRQQADDKLAELRQRIRKRTGRSDLRFAAEPPKNDYGYPDQALRVELENLSPKIVLPEGDVVAVIEIDDDGEAAPTFWWPSHKERRAARGASADQLSEGGDGPSARSGERKTFWERMQDGSAFDRHSDGSQKALSAVRDEHGLSGAGVQVVRSLRRELLRALLVDDAEDGGTLGQDFITWAQLRQEFSQFGRREGAADIGARGLAGGWSGQQDAEPLDDVRPHLEQSGAHQTWRTGLKRLQAHPAFTIEDTAAALAAYVRADEIKPLAGAVLAGLALLRSANVRGWRIPAHDKLAALAGGSDIALRHYWQPTPSFLGLFPKMKRLELAEPVAGHTATTRWSKLKDVELATVTAGALAGEEEWLHPLLSFGIGSDDPVQENEPALREAAE